jgi:hypothetical protein
MLPRQVHETSTCHLQARAGHLVLSLDLVMEGMIYVALVELVGLVGCFLEEQGKRLLCSVWLQLRR